MLNRPLCTFFEQMLTVWCNNLFLPVDTESDQKLAVHLVVDLLEIFVYWPMVCDTVVESFGSLLFVHHDQMITPNTSVRLELD